MVREILSKYVDLSNLEDFDYLKITFSNRTRHPKRSVFGPGLCDQTDQLKTYLSIARELGLILILPRRYLTGYHNGGRQVESDLTEFYNFSKLKINGEVIETKTYNDEYDEHRVLKFSPMFYKDKLKVDGYLQKSSHIELPLSEEDISIAKKCVDIFNIGVVIHIRRTDKLNELPSGRNTPRDGHTVHVWDYATRSENILKVLGDMGVSQNVYVMTDMPSDDEIISDLKKSNYGFKFYFDSEELVMVKQENNYKLFNIECCIRDMVDSHKNTHDLIHYYLENDG
jgi:hypothetical protein